MKVVKPPEKIPETNEQGIVPRSIFLAGSIGASADLSKLAEDWQDSVTKVLDESGLFDFVFNPRRDDFDSSWEQSASNPKFNEQVTWEMDALDAADYIVVYFHPDTQAPISLMELGLHADDARVAAVCPDGFWRKGNVEMVCLRYDIPLYGSMEDFIKKIRIASRMVGKK